MVCWLWQSNLHNNMVIMGAQKNQWVNNSRMEWRTTRKLSRRRARAATSAAAAASAATLAIATAAAAAVAFVGYHY